MSMTLEQAKEKLAKYGQEHVLKYYGELNEEEKQGILAVSYTHLLFINVVDTEP